MTPLLLSVDDPSRVAETRRAARRLALEMGFSDDGSERVAIAVTEVCTNLLKHAGGGEVILSAVGQDGHPLVEVLALDRGPGMSDVALCARDGFSTTGTLGQGLGAIERIASYCDVYSQSGTGTAIVARLSDRRNGALGELRIHGLNAPKPGEDACGDAWTFHEHDASRATMLLADGLGHGVAAAAAARRAVEIANENFDRSPAAILESVHAGLRHTRGAAVGVAELDREQGYVRFATLGNISGRIGDASSDRHLVSMNGIAGGDARNTVREFEYPFAEGAALVLHSDGLSARWGFSDYAGLLARDPGIISGVLFRDHRRMNDDSSILVAK